MADQTVMTGMSGTVYRFVFGSNAICRMEEHTGEYYAAMLEQLRSPSCRAKYARAWVWACLQDQPGLTIEQAGDILDDIGGAGVVLAAFQDVQPPTPAEIAASAIT